MLERIRLSLPRGVSSTGTRETAPRPISLLLARPELVAIVVLTTLAFALPGNVISAWRVVPIGILGFGLAQGAPLAMQAMGMVLVYRSNRIINFSQVAMGSMSGYLFYNLEVHREFIFLYSKFGGRIGPSVLFAPYPMQILNLIGAFVVAILVAPLVGFIAYFGVIRFFEKVPPVMVTVATIGLAYLIPTLITHIKDLNVWPDDGYTMQLPLDVILFVKPATMHLADLAGVLMVLVAGAGIALFLRMSAVGVVLRASADNMTRARTLGISVGSMISVVWVISALLGGLAAILAAAGGTQPKGFQADGLVMILAVVVIARSTSLPMAVVGGLGLAMIRECLSWSLNGDSLFQGLLLVIVTVFLLIQRRQRSRTDVGDERFPAAVEVRPIPRELKDFYVVKRYLRLGMLLSAVILIGYPWVSSPAQADSATVGMIYAMIGLSLLVLTGWSGQISLGQMAFAAVGSAVTAILTVDVGLPMPLSILAAAAAGAVVAAVVGLPALRLPGLNLAVVTLALGLATTSILLNPQYLGASIPVNLDRPGLLGLDTSDQRVFYYIVLAALVIVVGAILGIRKSRVARALIACRDNEQAAQAFGINLFRARLQAFAFSGFIAAGAGGLFAFQQHGVHPPAYAADVSLQNFLVTIIGGLGSVWGPTIGQAAYIIVPALNVPVLTELSIPIAALVLLLFYPSGLGGLIFGMRDGILRRIAVRYRILVPSLLADYRGDRRKARAPVAPKTRRGGRAVFVPPEYSLNDQWSVPVEARLPGRETT